MALWMPRTGLVRVSSLSSAAYSGSAFAAKGNVFRAKKTLKLYRHFESITVSVATDYRPVVATVDYNGSNSSIINAIKHSGAAVTVSAVGLVRLLGVAEGVVIEAGEYVAIMSVRFSSSTAVNQTSFPGADSSPVDAAVQQLEWVHGIRYASAAPAVSDEVFFSTSNAVYSIIGYGA